MGRILESITSFMQSHFEGDGLEDDQQLEPVDGETLIFRFTGSEDRQWGCLVVSDEEAEQVMFYSTLFDRAPEPRRDEVMRFVTMANYGMSVGNFELDLGDGEVRFKTAVDVEGVDLSPVLCRNLVELNLMMMEHYHDGLLAVIEGGSSAAEAIEAIEGHDDDADEPAGA